MLLAIFVQNAKIHSDCGLLQLASGKSRKFVSINMYMSQAVSDYVEQIILLYLCTI